MNDRNNSPNGRDSQNSIPRSKLAPPILAQDDTDNSDKTTLRIWPKLAGAIGLNECILLLQIEYLLRLPDRNDYKLRDGRRWVYHSIRSFKDEFFPFWSKDTIDRAIKSLMNQGLIVVANYNRRKGDKTRWFTLNLEVIAALKDKPITLCLSQNETAYTQNETAYTQNETGVSQNETTLPETPPEITQKTITERGTPAPTSANNSFSSQSQQAIDLYQELTERKPNPVQKKALTEFIECLHGGFNLDLWTETIENVTMGGCKPSNIDAMINTYWWTSGDYSGWQDIRRNSDNGQDKEGLGFLTNKPHWSESPVIIETRWGTYKHDDSDTLALISDKSIKAETSHGLINLHDLDDPELQDEIYSLVESHYKEKGMDFDYRD